MKVIPIQSERVEVNPQQELAEWLQESISKNEEEISNGDIVVVSSKLVSFFEDRVMELSWVKPSERAQEIAEKMNVDPKLIELVICEADEVVAETPWVLLTRKNGTYCANAGIDVSNVPDGHAVLWPKDPFASADSIRTSLLEKTQLKNVAVIISDSSCVPGRKGTTAEAIAYSGFKGFQELRDSKDLYENTLRYSALNIADSLATSANLIMGEGDDSTPIALIKDYNWKPAETKNDEMIISPSDDMFPIV